MIGAKVAQEGLLVERLLVEELELPAEVCVRDACQLARLRGLGLRLSVDSRRVWPLTMFR